MVELPTVVRVQAPMLPQVVKVLAPAEHWTPPVVPRYGLVNGTINTGVLTLDFTVASTYRVVLTENVTSIVFAGSPSAGEAQRLVVYFVQDGVGNRQVNGWPGNVKWPGGVIAEVTGDPSVTDCFVIDTIDGGVTYLAARAVADWR